MPGFNICGTGDGPSATIETRRKHRWLFQTLGKGGGDQFPANVLLILQSAQRPDFKFEEPEMHHNQEVARFAGKQDWEPITLTWYDAEQPQDASAQIWDWFEHVVNFAGADVQIPGLYKAEGRLQMQDGNGTPSETWRLCNTWPKEFNGGDLDYTDTEIATVEVTMRFDRALRVT
jgi:hypothetical protein